MSRPILSFVVPAYNAEGTLQQCLESLLAQSISDIEVIVVNDGSTDNTGAVADYLAASEPRVKVIHQVNGGLSRARNAGLKVVQGEYVAFIDSDDWVEPFLAEHGVQSCRNGDADVGIFGFFVDHLDQEENLVQREVRDVPDVTLSAGQRLSASLVDPSLVNALGYAWNKIYRLSWLRGSGILFEPGLSLIEDIVFNSAIFVETPRCLFSSQMYVHYQQRVGDSLGRRVEPSFFDHRLRAVESLGVAIGSLTGRSDLALAQMRWAARAGIWGGVVGAFRMGRRPGLLRSMCARSSYRKMRDIADVSWRADWRAAWTVLCVERGLFSMVFLPIVVGAAARVLLRKARRLPSGWGDE